MLKFRLVAIGMLLMSIAACAITPPAQVSTPLATTRDTHEKLHGVLLMQTSAEYQVLTRIAYAQARLSVDAALADSTWTAAVEQTGSYSSLPPAIIVDIDETIFDNSRFQGRLVSYRSEYQETHWQQWTEKHMATLVPGADDFLDYVSSKGVTTFYITNREISQETDTRQSLADLKLPLRSDLDVVLSKNENNWTSSDKSSRQAHVSRNFRVLLLVGDDLGDFVSGAKDTPENRVKLSTSHSAFWGKRWILIPNPLYGTWEAALFGHDFKIPDKDVLEIKFRNVQRF